MTRHLIEPVLVSALNRGKEVHQLLSVRPVDGRWEVRYVTLWKTAGEHVVALSEIYLDTPEQPGDVTALDESDPLGERWKHFASLEGALGWIESELGGSRTRFVNSGVLQDEVNEALRRTGPRRGEPVKPGGSK